jgi:hypothetical protein
MHEVLIKNNKYNFKYNYYAKEDGSIRAIKCHKNWKKYTEGIDFN